MSGPSSSAVAQRVTSAANAVVVGGGIAGLAAATVLAERGVGVTVLEREAYLGGRAGAWSDVLDDGTSFQMERGFHAFFRQYYNLRALLRRFDPTLSFLRPLDDYPILGPNGEAQSFAGLPTRVPWNIIELTRRSPAMGWKDLMRIDGRRAARMLSYNNEDTYRRFDTDTASEFLDSLNFPPAARRMLFDVFAHSFFNPENDMSAAELLMMFHFYFTGNPDGLVFDVARTPFSTAIFAPWQQYLEQLGVRFECETTAQTVARDDNVWRVETDRGHHEGQGLVVATTVPGLQALVAQSSQLDAPRWQQQIDSLALTLPFVVWRLWLDRPTRRDRKPFVGITGRGILDNISLYHQFESESRDWADSHGGSVVELHAYAVEPGFDEALIKAQLLEHLHELYPETAAATIVEERWIVRRDCPAFAPGSYSRRPTVVTPFPQMAIAGDFVRLPFPSALMERAAASGLMAANHLLNSHGVAPEPVQSVSNRGLLAGLPL